jgi:hypothetical protein
MATRKVRIFRFELTINWRAELMVYACEHYLRVLLHYKFSLKFFLGTDIGEHKNNTSVASAPVSFYAHVKIASPKLNVLFLLFFFWLDFCRSVLVFIIRLYLIAYGRESVMHMQKHCLFSCDINHRLKEYVRINELKSFVHIC